jgi:hypothetical protein
MDNLNIIENKDELIIKYSYTKGTDANFNGCTILLVSIISCLIIPFCLFKHQWLLAIFVGLAPVFVGIAVSFLYKEEKETTTVITLNSEFITTKYNSFFCKDISRVYLVLWGIHYEVWVEKNDGEKVRMLGEKEGFKSKSQKYAKVIIGKIEDFLSPNEPQSGFIIHPTITSQAKNSSKHS